MNTLLSSGSQDLVFLLLVAQFLVALWLSCRLHRDEPNWKILSFLSSLLLLGLPGLFAIRAIRHSFLREHPGNGVLPPQNR